MTDPRLMTDISEIKALVREQSVRQQQTDLANEARMTRVESGIAEIKTDVAEINKRGAADHDEIVKLQSQMAIRPAMAFVASTITSALAMFFGLPPRAQ